MKEEYQLRPYNLRLALGVIGAGLGAGIGSVIPVIEHSALSAGIGGSLGFLSGWVLGYLSERFLLADRNQPFCRLYNFWSLGIGITSLCLVVVGVLRLFRLGHVSQNIPLVVAITFFSCVGILMLLLGVGQVASQKIKGLLALLFSMGSAYVALSSDDSSVFLAGIFGFIFCVACAAVYLLRPDWLNKRKK